MHLSSLCFSLRNISFAPAYKFLYLTLQTHIMKEITVEELKSRIEKQDTFQLIDVRESFEFELSNLGGLNIPLINVPLETEAIRKDIPVFVLCRIGRRSAMAVMKLEELGFSNVYNIAGGITNWKEKFAPDMPVF